MKPGQTLWTIIVLACVVGCAGPREAATDRQYRTVRFESEPSGARVFIGYGSGVGAIKSREYVGQTPCEARVPSSSDGRFDGQGGIVGVSVFVPQLVEFSAEIGTNVVRQVIRSGALAQSADRIPAKVFFDFEKPGP